MGQEGSSLWPWQCAIRHDHEPLQSSSLFVSWQDLSGLIWPNPRWWIYTILCFIQYFHMVLFFGGRQPTPRSSLYYKNSSPLNDRLWVQAFMSNLFKQLGILPLKSQYIYSILLFISKNSKLFTTNYDAHNLQTRHRNDLHLPTSTLTLYQKGVYYSGIKLFNNLPRNIKEIVGSPKQFKIA
jgi:hypothetical protein